MKNTVPYPFLPRFGFLFLWLLAPLLAQADYFWTERARPMPEWVENEVIYEVNIRQYSEEGTFAALEADLDRIQDLGVGILWLMPIHPIGEVNRKGELGSYYAVKDYRDVNPEFGDKAAFKSLVEAIHARGMRVILDWVANHSAWDNPLTETRPDLYERDDDGNLVPPHGTDWTDVVQFDINHPGLADYHIGAMRYWIETYDVDGFRCDYALGLPMSFWNEVNAALREVKPELFMLAESDSGAMHLEAFDLTYGWKVMHQFDRIAQGKAPANSLDGILADRRLALPRGANEMLFTSNHDENSWLGTVFERLGGGIEPFAVLSMTLNGVPLIYNGQEAGLNKRLEFFQRDPIDWQPSPLFDFYRKLIDLRKTHPALRTGMPFHRVATTMDESIYAFMRKASDGRSVLVVANLTAKDAEFVIGGPDVAGTWTELFSGATEELGDTTELQLNSWDYLVLYQ